MPDLTEVSWTDVWGEQRALLFNYEQEVVYSGHGLLFDELECNG